jgi:hypothetical protein
MTSEAVVVFGSGDPTHNTTAPTGALATAGWQWEGNWVGLAATAIGPHHIITAAHAGGAIGGYFNFRGKNYMATESHLAPNADLRVFTVAGTLPDFAPLYTGSSETGRGLFMVGAGGVRGEAVTLTVGAGKKLKGWLWGARDGQFRWATNTIAAVVGSGTPATRSPLPDDLIACTFDSTAGGDEGTITDGDSGGGAFILDAGKWKLAAVLRAVESKFRTTATDGDFSAALFDKGGFYQFTGAAWELVPTLVVDRPTVFYGARISGSATWLQQVLAGSVAPETALAVESSDSPSGPFTPDTSVTLDLENARFVAPITGSTRYYHLVDNRGWFSSATVSGSTLYLNLNN